MGLQGDGIVTPIASSQRTKNDLTDGECWDMAGTAIATMNGRPGIIVPKAWANDKDGVGVYWNINDEARGTVMVDYYDHGNIDLSTDEPFGGVAYHTARLHETIMADEDVHGGLIFVGVGRTRKDGVQYSANIMRMDAGADDEGEIGRMYVANILLAIPELDEVANIVATTMSTSSKAGDREADVRSRFGESGVIRERDGMVIRWQEDPYDASFDAGVPMFAYERASYDKDYPKHPLTMIRRLVGFVIVNN